jgi:hypothetical protein
MRPNKLDILQSKSKLRADEQCAFRLTNKTLMRIKSDNWLCGFEIILLTQQNMTSSMTIGISSLIYTTVEEKR